MIKRFCDRCKREVRSNGGRVAYKERVGSQTFEVEVMSAVGGTWNGGDLCRDCIKALVAMSTGEPSPSAEDRGQETSTSGMELPTHPVDKLSPDALKALGGVS